MKTKLQIISVALFGLFLASCSSSMYMSKTSVTPTDDIYYTPNKSTSTLTNYENSTTLNSQNLEPSKQNFDNLEKKYSEILASDTTNIDTLVYKSESTNPYKRILSDSYQESYERRLKGLRDPMYGSENIATFYNQDYFYASAYDPMFYHPVVMGNQIWVEPWYISSMYSWPNNHFSIGFGWNSWYSNYYSPYSGYSNWYGWDPYYWNRNYYTSNNNFNYNNNYYYGRRNGSLTTNETAINRNRLSYEDRIISTRNRNGISTATSRNSDINNNIRSRNTNQSTEISARGQRNTQEGTSINNRTVNSNTSRLRNEGTNRTINRTEPTRRNYESGSLGNANYQRPRSTNNNDYIRSSTRNQNINSGSNTREINTRNTSTTTREARNTTPTYNSPSRVGTSSARGVTTSSGRSNSDRESTYSKPATSNSSSSGSSTHSTSSGSSNSSSSGSSTNTRRR